MRTICKQLIQKTSRLHLFAGSDNINEIFDREIAQGHSKCEAPRQSLRKLKSAFTRNAGRTFFIPSLRTATHFTLFNAAEIAQPGARCVFSSYIALDRSRRTLPPVHCLAHRWPRPSGWQRSREQPPVRSPLPEPRLASCRGATSPPCWRSASSACASSLPAC